MKRPDRNEDQPTTVWDAVAQRVLGQLNGEMTVLEIGCGSGHLTLRLCGATALWEATDLSERAIRRARAIPHSDRLRFSVQDPANLPFEHATFDAAVATNILPRLPRPELALRELAYVLKPGGLLFAPTAVSGTAGRAAPAGRKDRGLWTAGELTECLAAEGFSLECAVLLPDDSDGLLLYAQARSVGRR